MSSVLSFRREANPTATSPAPASGRDESARDVRGLMRVGNYASRTMVRGESVVELVLMCASESWGCSCVRTYVRMYVCTYICMFVHMSCLCVCAHESE